jgi:Lon protease-like protein
VPERLAGGPDEHGPAVFAHGARVGSDVVVDGASITTITDNTGSWPPAGRPGVVGLRYAELRPSSREEGTVTLPRRLDWLARGIPDHAPRPHEQLAAYCRSTGDEAAARTVLLVKERGRGRNSRPGPGRQGLRLVPVTDRLPLFPLNTVLFPGLVLPLTVFEERYVAMLRDLLDRPEEERRFGVVALRAGAAEVGRLSGDPARAVHRLGCVAQIASVKRLGDEDRFEVMATGSRRFRLLGLDTSRPYLVGEVEELAEPPGGDAPAARAAAVRAFTEYQRRLLSARERETLRLPELPDDPVVMSYLVAAAMILEVREKQELLAAEDATLRLAHEIRLLRRETLLLTHTRTLPALDLAKRPADLN